MIWLNALQAHVNQGTACVVVTVADVIGSAPRKPGAHMVVSRNQVDDTIGGGALEQAAIDHARQLLERPQNNAGISTQTHALGKQLSQCCGGKVTLHYELHPANQFSVVVFGAGHVAQCLSTVLQQLPCRVQFYDNRQAWLNKLTVLGGQQSHALMSTHLLGENTFAAVDQCPDRAYYVIMTHSHELDFELTEAVLSRGDSVYCGLIASKAKAARFRSRLARKGFTELELARMTSPIGEHYRTGNLPMEIAMAVSLEMLQVNAGTVNTNHQLQPETANTETKT